MDTVQLAYDVYSDEDTRSDLCPIILIHGFLWNKYMYRDLATKLSRATERKVFCLDLRDHGTSPSTKEPSAVAMAEDVKSFMKEQTLQKVAFICHSFSSTIAYIITLDMPESVEKLIMVDNVPFTEFDEKLNKEHVYPQLETQNRMLGILKPTMTLKEAKEKFRNLASATSGDRGKEAFYKKVAYDLTKENGKFRWKHDFNNLMQRYKEGFFCPKPWGSSDKEILMIRRPNSASVRNSRFDEAKIQNPNARLVELEDTTHLLMFEEPERFIQVAKEFLKTAE